MLTSAKTRKRASPGERHPSPPRSQPQHQISCVLQQQHLHKPRPRLKPPSPAAATTKPIPFLSKLPQLLQATPTQPPRYPTPQPAATLYLGVPREVLRLLVLDDLLPAVGGDELLLLVEHQERRQGRHAQQLRDGAASLAVVRHRQPRHVSHVAIAKMGRGGAGRGEATGFGGEEGG